MANFIVKMRQAFRGKECQAAVVLSLLCIPFNMRILYIIEALWYTSTFFIHVMLYLLLSVVMLAFEMVVLVLLARVLFPRQEPLIDPDDEFLRDGEWYELDAFLELLHSDPEGDEP